MRLIDTITLAATKLKSHRVRTGVITGVSGVLFGLLVAIIVIAQGVFDSAERFSSVGVGDRYIVQLTTHDAFFVGDHLQDEEVIAMIEEEQKKHVAMKQAAAKKHNIEYEPKIEDPLPISVDSEGSKEVDFDVTGAPYFKAIEEKIRSEKVKPVDHKESIRQFSTVKELGLYKPLFPEDGTLLYMKDGKEQALSTDERNQYDSFGLQGDDDRSLYILPQTIADPFVSIQDYDPTSGDLPVIMPYGDVERLLGFSRLPKDAAPQVHRDRAREVYSRAGEVKVGFCYRNQASNSMLSQAKATDKEMQKNAGNKDYIKPALVYSIPNETDCGEVKVVSDTRTIAEKQDDDRRKLYDQEVGAYMGEPEQHKLTLRVVGVSSGGPSNGQSSVSEAIESMLSTSLGYNSWNIPAGLLEQTPESARPGVVFEDRNSRQGGGMFGTSVLLEFGDSDEARKLISSLYASQNSWAMAFGSPSLVVGELKSWFEKAIFWVVVVVGAVAVIILSGLVGRTIADSRKETAVFRSIGATRGDIAGIYTIYTLLFSLRVVLFALALGLVLATIIHLLWTENATIGAELALGAVNSGLQFGFIGLRNLYLLIIVGVIVVVGLISVILPILRNVGRSPIKDMRDE